ncbi:MAG: hypothetical protein ABS62_05745 [Microbacterium sp. SCN 70-200]|uniref:DUF485 domain-containing protein n=1 Tax=unclassified Microbacterium TaxID=2609290 RepID=UPI00086A100E|nr:MULTISPECIES: DUF485 domain-containing protein [unclassified Microbacterium]MBN9213491.1 DUF485 domain-containing protein [Microbacterium sp.]ODT41687.1 MAG: hypothetical protein ABS62_05745 [Microbacterium sp. SCN 70-200]OJV85122.1 MAG: hypothetical protein BGO46_11110 [Microbacterium sp. 70-16]
MSVTPRDAAPTGGIDYVAEEESARYVELKRRHRSFVWPLTIAFLVWYFAYVLLSSFATEFMATKVWGDITIGLLLGLGQFVTTFAITMGYVSYANRRLDPLTAEIREDLERQEAAL